MCEVLILGGVSPRPTRGYDNAFMPTVAHKGIVLRPYQATDAEAFAVAVRESVDTVGLWMPWCHAAYSQQEALLWFDTCAQGLADGSSFEFGVFAEENGSFLGGAGLNHFNVDHNFCNLGYWVRQSRHRQGIAFRAAEALSTFAFANLGLTRLEIVVAQGNEPSCAVARKLGAEFECVARNRLVVFGTPMAASVHSLVPAVV